MYENITNQLNHNQTRIRSEIAVKRIEDLSSDFPGISLPFKRRKMQDLESLLETVKVESLTGTYLNENSYDIRFG